MQLKPFCGDGLWGRFVGILTQPLSLAIPNLGRAAYEGAGGTMDKGDKERLEQDRRDALTLASQNIRWVYSSLLLVHGAALVALLGASDRLPVGALQAARCFTTGLVSALSAGALVIFAAYGAATRFQGDLEKDDRVATFGCAVQFANSFVAAGFLFWSVYSFVVGVMQVGVALGIGTLPGR